MQTGQNPQLSIVVPALNEADELPFLFATLGNQSGINFELILCDGGSTDNTLQLAEQLAQGWKFPVRCLRTGGGRGCQMNAGAAMARGDILLFLHADSRLFEQDAIANAVQAFEKERAETGASVAGRLGLCFRRQTRAPSLAYRFYEAKTRLNRADCIRGDQGFMISRHFFNALGRFDESLPFLEDVRLALAIGEQACWVLLPAEISTSARRFETEGLYERQVVNAIIANALTCGWTELLTRLPGLYRRNVESGRLQLHPLLNSVRSLLARHPLRWRATFWYATGRHIAANIWQLFFWLDVRSGFKAGLPPETPPRRWSEFFSRHLEPLAHSIPLAVMTTLAAWLWFRLLLVTSRRKARLITETTRTD